MTAHASGMCLVLLATLRDCGALLTVSFLGSLEALTGGFTLYGPSEAQVASIHARCFCRSQKLQPLKLHSPLQEPGTGAAESTTQPLEAGTAAAASRVPQTQAGGISVKPQQGSAGEEAGQLSGAYTGQLWLQWDRGNSSGCALCRCCWSCAGLLPSLDNKLASCAFAQNQFCCSMGSSCKPAQSRHPVSAQDPAGTMLLDCMVSIAGSSAVK